MQLPRMMRVKQRFDGPALEDIPGAVREEIAKQNLSGKVARGDSVAISVGSRGIANIALITRTAIEELQALGAEPFVVPAMGSHGGGRAEGQREIIESYGVTEEYIGAPIRSSMEVVQVGETGTGCRSSSTSTRTRRITSSSPGASSRTPGSSARSRAACTR